MAIRNNGNEVAVHLLRHNIDTEKQAYDVESAAIDLIEYLQPGQLLNVVLGHHHAQHGLMTAEHIETLYAAPEAPRPQVPTMLVSLNKVWTPLITDEALQESTTGWWRAGGARHRDLVYIMGVHNGVVRSVYRILSWCPAAQDPSRWGCDVGPAPEMSHWMRTSVRRYLTANQWSIRYIGPESQPAGATGSRSQMAGRKSASGEAGR
ncbi:MAG: GIY-YIG nuclease family protein [Mycobacteriales bacterium]